MAALGNAEELGAELLRDWAGKVAARIDQRIASDVGELLRDARATCDDQFDRILVPAFVGISAIPQVDAFALQPGDWAGRRMFADLFRGDGTVRAGARAAARDHLVSMIERESARLIEWCVDYFDEACAQLHAVFVNALDEFARAASIASARARIAMADTRHAITQAHEHIDAWLRMLDDLHRRLE